MHEKIQIQHICEGFNFKSLWYGAKYVPREEAIDTQREIKQSNIKMIWYGHGKNLPNLIQYLQNS